MMCLCNDILVLYYALVMRTLHSFSLQFFSHVYLYMYVYTEFVHVQMNVIKLSSFDNCLWELIVRLILLKQRQHFL